MTARPLIGVLLDYQEEGTFSRRPHYALRCAYFDAVWKAGGLPVGMPYINDAWDDYLAAVGGVIVPGGFYPFPEVYYGGEIVVAEPPHPRHAAEVPLARAAIAQDIPFLGICAGLQVLAAVEGANLIRDLKSETDGTIDHLNEKPAEEPAHAVAIKPDTLLHRIVGKDEIMVNTAHNEAPRELPASLIVNAIAPDGVIEGAERPDRKFCLGVQWHPEFFLKDGDPNLALFQALVEAAR
ncbi:MAG: gamma-glutamyl-gamma-aminobutyrate hydrolase family protein [Rhodospirillales bacterium]